MKNAYVAVSLLAFAISGPVWADGKSHDHKSAEKAMKMNHNAGAMSSGEVRRVSKGSKKLTVKHGPIENLDMPPMTMSFVVPDAQMLERVKKGDKINFRAESVDGKMVITEMTVQ